MKFTHQVNKFYQHCLVENMPSGSGTSMAAPVVSGIAAFRFDQCIQIETCIRINSLWDNLFLPQKNMQWCNNPMFHGLHNIPMIVDAYSALGITKTRH